MSNIAEKNLESIKKKLPSINTETPVCWGSMLVIVDCLTDIYEKINNIEEDINEVRFGNHSEDE